MFEYEGNKDGEMANSDLMDMIKAAAISGDKKAMHVKILTNKVEIEIK